MPNYDIQSRMREMQAKKASQDTKASDKPEKKQSSSQETVKIQQNKENKANATDTTNSSANIVKKQPAQDEKTDKQSEEKIEKPAHTSRDSKRSDNKRTTRRVSTNTTGIATIPWEGKFNKASLGSMPRDVINIAQESFPELNQTQSVFAYVIANSDKEIPIYTPESIKNMIEDYRNKQYFDKVGDDLIEIKMLIKNMFVLMRKMSLTSDVTEVEVSTLLATYLGFTRNRPSTVDQVDAGDLYLKEFSDKFKDYVKNISILRQRKDGRPIR